MPKSPLNQAEIFASDLLGEGKNADTLDGLDSLAFMRRDESTMPTQDNSYDLGTETMRWKNLYIGGTITGVGLEHMLRDDADAVPAADLTFSLGSPTNRWSTLYVDQINGLDTTMFMRKDSENFPTETNKFDFGSSGLRWKTMYTVGFNTTGISMFNGATNFNESVTVNSNNLDIVNGDINVTGGNVESPLFIGDLEGTAARAKYADLAEVYSTDDDHQIGTVMTVAPDGGSEARAAKAGEIVLGVVSAKPAYLMNSDADGQAIGLVGRVPVRFEGVVSKGQRLYVSATTPGVATANGNGKTFAWANENGDAQSDKYVECILMKE